MSNEQLLEQMQAMLLPLQEKVQALEEENKTLKLSVDMASGTSSTHANTAGRTVNMRTARSVVIATRPVVDSPDDPRWAGRVVSSTTRPTDAE